VLVGLGAATRIESARVRWPDGTVEKMKEPLVDKYTTVKRNR